MNTTEFRKLAEANGVALVHIDFTGEPFKCCTCRKTVTPEMRRNPTSPVIETRARCASGCKQVFHNFTCGHDEVPKLVRLADMISVIETGELR